MKPEYVFVLSRTAGPCRLCRHANQGTVDLAEGHLFCGQIAQPKSRDDTCTVTVPAPRRTGEPVEAWASYFLFERFDGENLVEYGGGGYNAKVFPEDADGERAEALLAALRALPRRS